ncbi:MAG: CDP-alcohol phosphatidyltransferase family protein [Prevotella sp.]|nr:CDP-alcohol phosphatidyltransferase family protein [Prevotella sp.]
MNEQYFQTLKSAETEDWLDFHVIRPFCFQLARFFAKFDINPNTITIWSMIIGAGSAFFFAKGCFYYEGIEGLLYNLFAIFLLMWADFFDCTDGQLARLTGKKSRLGRILDGTAGFVWFIPIYLALVWRFYHHHEIEFSWLGISDTPENTMIATIVVFILGNISGFLGMGGQSRMADYYIQVHLFFLKGEKDSELDNSKRQQELYDQLPADTPYYERWFQKSYIDYTKKQEKSTPQFQRLLALLKEKYGSVDNIPTKVREDIHKNSLALMKWNGLLTFNFRETWFFLFCLLDVPVMNFIFEVVCMSLLTMYINHRHESFCRRIADGLK